MTVGEEGKEVGGVCWGGVGDCWGGGGGSRR